MSARRVLVLILLVAAVVVWPNQTALAKEPEPPVNPNWPEVAPTAPPDPVSKLDGEQPPGALSLSDIPLQPTAPDHASIDDFVGRPQTLPLSCESRSAVDWAGYFGFKIDELAFLRALPVSADPDIGFVGDVRGDWGQVPPNAYGVHAGPVARLLQQYGVLAAFELYTPWQTVQSEVAAGRPVMVWVTGHVGRGQGQIYTAPGGHRTVVAPYEHTVIVIGYGRGYVMVEDEGQHYLRSLDVFLQSWGALRNMAILAGGQSSSLP